MLQTERLSLRRFTEADLDNLINLDSDPAVMRWLNGGVPTPRAVIADSILPGFLRSYAPPCYGVWAIILTASGDFLGWVSLRPDGERANEATLGYRLLRVAWGQGYASEVARALLAAAFRGEPALQRVTATTYQDNTASRRVMERLDMSLVRTFRYTPADLAATDTHVPGVDLWDGEDVEYAITRAEWERTVP